MIRPPQLLAFCFSLCAVLSCPAQLPSATPRNVPANPQAATPAPTAGSPLARPSATPFAGFSSPTASASSAAALTPLDAPLKEQAETLITCELTKAPTLAECPIFTSPKEADTCKGVWHYKLWLPQGYLAVPSKKWPCMFIMSAGGNAGMGQMSEHLKAKGYVVVLLVESKNGEWGPVVGNFLAAHDDVIKRVRIEEGKKFATGMSGGARGSSLFVQARPGFGGLILQGAGPAFSKNGYEIRNLRSNTKLFVAMTMGDKDNNQTEVERTRTALSAPDRFFSMSFSGGHQWAPKETFEQAIAWVEQKNGM